MDAGFVLNRGIRYLGAIAGVSIAYYAAARLGLVLAFGGTNASPVWPPSGVALAAVLLLGSRALPGIFVAAVAANTAVFLDNQVAGLQTALFTSIVVAFGNTLEAFVGGYLFRRLIGRQCSLARATDALRFVMMAGLMCLASSTVGPTAICASGIAGWSAFQQMWFTWWLGNLAGVLVITPLLFGWRDGTWSRPRLARLAERALALGLLVLVGQTLFGGWFPGNVVSSLPYLIVPLLVWVALRFDQREAAIAVTIVSGLAVWGTIHGHGPFLRAPLNDALLLVQGFVCVVAIVSVALSAARVEHSRAATGLERYQDRLEGLVREQTAGLTAANRQLRSEIERHERAQRALGRSQSVIQTVINAARDAIIAIGEDGAITVFNPAAERMFGRQADDVLGGPLDPLMPPQFRAPHRDCVAGHFGGQRPGSVIGQTIELPALRGDGTVFPMEISLSPGESAEGRFVLGVARDISGRKQQEERHALTCRVLELLNQPGSASDIIEGLLQTIRDATGFEAVGCRLKDGDDYPYYQAFGFPSRFVEAERSLCPRRVSGQVERDATGRPVLECMCGNVIRGRIDPTQPFFTEGGSFFTNSSTDLLAAATENDLQGTTRNRCHGEGYESIALIPLRSGTEIIGLLQLNDHRRGMIGPGLIEYLQGIGSTIGIAIKRKRAEQTARQLAAIVESSDDAIIGTALDGTINAWNDAARRLYGYDTEEALGKPLSILGSSEQIGLLSETATGNGNGHSVDHVETVHRHRSGTPIDVLLTVSPVRESDGTLLGVSVIARDITERKRAEQQRRDLESRVQRAQKLESLDALAGGVAHDFNNLLVGVLGNAELALDTLPPESPARPLIGRIEQAAHRAAELTKQMLAFSGKGHFLIKPLNLSALIDTLDDTLQNSVGPTARLRYTLAASLPLVDADATQLQQVVTNLVVNASEALGEQTGEIVVRTGFAGHNDTGPLTLEGEEGPPSGDYVFVEVADTGCGMDEETCSRVFEPFFSTKFTGRGLGLAAVWGIVRGHQGTIRVRSAVGQGTTFIILLPVSKSHRLASALPDTGPAQGPGRTTILVADDEEAVLSVAVAALERTGFRTLAARDGREAEALFRARNKEIDAVLLDLTMPHLSGEEVLRRIGRLRPDMPVILASGYSEEEVTNRITASNVAGFIQKPFTINTLTAKIRGALGEPDRASLADGLTRMGDACGADADRQD